MTAYSSAGRGLAPVVRRFRRAFLVLALTWLPACSGTNDISGPALGSLILTILGLDSGTNAAVTVTGPGGFSRTVGATSTIGDLTPGAYLVSAANVTTATGRFAPASATQTVNVAAGNTPATVTVTYALATGSLAITVSGLPGSSAAAVSVSGPNNYQRTVTATTTLNALDPGSYTVAASPVTVAEDRYSAASATQTVTVAAGSTPVAAAVTYALSSGRLTVTISGLPSGGAGAVTVTGPGGFSRALTATTTLVQLEPGTYTIAASNAVAGGYTHTPTPATQNAAVVASATPLARTVTYAPTDGAIVVTITGLPQGSNASVTVTGPGGFMRLLSGSGTVSALPAGVYSVTAANVTVGMATYAGTPTSTNVTVSVGATAQAAVAYAPAISLGLQLVVSGLNRPVHLVSPTGDPRLFVVEQVGRIRIIQNGQLLAQPFLDISGRIGGPQGSESEQGLLALAFHPQYATNGFFFVYYTDFQGDVTVERLQVSGSPNVANAAGTVVLSVPHRFDPDHNGGAMTFGPDGLLYIAIGDGGCCGDPLRTGQNLDTLLGKALRIDVSSLPYTIPAGNPFIGQAGRRPEIWAYGLRNPWRIDFDDNYLYIADVGEDAWEEVNVVARTLAGANFGWSITEGSSCFGGGQCNMTGITMPAVEFSHGEGCSVTGGFSYRGTALPELTGHYFYSDFCGRFLRSFLFTGGAATQRRDWGITVPSLVTSFGEDGAGELYMLTINGSVYRIVRQ